MINPSNPGFFPCFSQQFMRYQPHQPHQPHHFPHVFPPESRCTSAPSGIRSAAAPRSLRSDGYKPRAWARGEGYHHRPQPKGCRWMERDSSLQPIESRPLVAWWLWWLWSLWKAARGNWGDWWFQWWMFRMGDGLMPCLLEDTCCNSPQTVGFTMSYPIKVAKLHLASTGLEPW